MIDKTIERRALKRVKIGVGLTVLCLTFALQTSIARADSFARYVLYKNCGDYTVSSVQVQEKIGGIWMDVDGARFSAPLDRTEGVCFDLGAMDGVGSGYVNDEETRVRLKVSIYSGDTERCDDTRINTLANGLTRVFSTHGTTSLRNSCRSEGYQNWGPSTQVCAGNGKIRRNLPC